MISKKIHDDTFEHKIIHVSELPFQFVKHLKLRLSEWFVGKPTFENMIDTESLKREGTHDSFKRNPRPYRMKAGRGIYYATVFSLSIWFFLIYFVISLFR